MNDLFHPWAWFIWLVGVALPALLTRNPLYHSILIGALLLDMWVLRQHRFNGWGWGIILRLVGGIALAGVLLNALTVHYGTHVWAHLPSSWPLIGGPLTWEAVLFGGASALALFTLMLLFAVWNMSMPPSRWLRMLPAALFQVGIITSIAITFVPVTVRTVREIYDAQRLRGHRFQRLWDYVPLFAPLLVDSLERSISLAESMAARGFGANVDPTPDRTRVLYQVMVGMGLLGIWGGLFARMYWPHPPLAAWMSLGGGSVLVLGVLWAQGRRVRRTRYRRWYWRVRDTALVGGSVVLLTVTLFTYARSPRMWLYYPYPPYSVQPSFEWFIGLVLVLAALPALLAPPRSPATLSRGKAEHP